MTKALARVLGITAVTAALSLGAWAQSMTREPGTNRRGNDYTSFRVSGSPECEEACARELAWCRALTNTSLPTPVSPWISNGMFFSSKRSA